MQDIPQSLILSAYPLGARVVEVQSYRPGYVPYPARVTVEVAGQQTLCVLKVGELAEAITREAGVLVALGAFGLPVPAVLAGPVAFGHSGTTAIILSELPGRPLPWLGSTDLNEAHLTCQLVQQAVDTLHNLTPLLSNHEISGTLAHVTLESELNAIVERSGPWFDVPVFREAVELLQAVLPKITMPLVFSNGDYNPLNFLHTNGTLTGWVDFENACFEHPYIGFAKFVLWANDEYGWGTGVKAGLVERYLYAHDVNRAEFLPRLVLRCLRHLQECSPVEWQNEFVPQQYMLNVLAGSVADLKR